MALSSILFPAVLLLLLTTGGDGSDVPARVVPQFLPQDMVCEFAKLTPIQLLEETEKVVGDPNLPFQHRLLTDKSKELNNLEVDKWRNLSFSARPGSRDKLRVPKKGPSSSTSPSSQTPLLLPSNKVAEALPSADPEKISCRMMITSDL
uniref:Uncharacterized protein n=1 Tax=Oryza brachyantha TaxID=4533 RepID=J3N1J2_ORYBR